jgi:hypothetical protein
MLQGLESLASDPALVNQLSQMMQNPEMQRQLQSMMAATGTTGNAGGGWNNPVFNGSVASSTSAVTASNSSNPNPVGLTASDEEMTEEEMIAEAIRRSLQDG